MSSAPAKSRPDAGEEQYHVTLEEAFRLAQGHHQNGNFMLAERTYRDILRAVPDHFPANQFLGILMFQSGSFDEALAYLGRALEMEPEDKNCLNNYGAVLTQQGRFDESIGYYEKALEVDPAFIDALNNQAYALWSLERYADAENMARRALKEDPDNINALINLGIALARQEKHDEAVKIWEAASKKSPDNAAVWANWGNTLREMNCIAESEKKCRRAVELDPANPDALNNLANALRDQGRIEESLGYYREATDLKPDFHQAHNNLAIALIEGRYFREAAAAARYAVAFRNDFAAAYSSLSRALMEMGEYDRAHAAALKQVRLDPESERSYLDLADILLRADRFDDGEAALQEALKREPDSARSLMKLAEIRERLNNLDGALEAIDKAIGLAPDMPVLRLRKANILQINNQVQEALPLIDEVLALAPQWPLALQLKAEMMVSLNRNAEAEKLARKILSLTGEIPGPYNILLGMKKLGGPGDEHFEALLALEEKADSFGLEGAASVYFALAELYEQKKDYDRAFACLKKGNDRRRKAVPYAPSRYDEAYEKVKSIYSPGFLDHYKGKGCDSDVPVFIIGMPRSGTTLTEQILSAHPDVFGAGELADLSIIRRLAESGESDVKILGEKYVKRIRAHEKEGRAKRIIDKMPANFMQLGFIASILPNAKIIHCRRDPIDTCLSCYSQNFARGQYWSYDLEELADEYNRYLDLMAYWRKILPGRFLEVGYEDTVGDLETQARRMIDYIGLEWNEACLRPHKQKRAVITASKSQVTKPVYKTSVAKWKRYEEYLQPLIEKLNLDLVPG